MEPITTIFKRGDNGIVINEQNADAAWVFQGEGKAFDIESEKQEIDIPRDFQSFAHFFGSNATKGIVFMHGNGKKAQITAQDFGVGAKPAADDHNKHAGMTAEEVAAKEQASEEAKLAQDNQQKYDAASGEQQKGTVLGSIGKAFGMGGKETPPAGDAPPAGDQGDGA